MTTPQQNYVVSVFAEPIQSEQLSTALMPFQDTWTHLPISGPSALEFLHAGTSLLRAIELDPRSADRSIFSAAALRLIPVPSPNDRFLVVSPTACPLDLVHDEIGNWGERAIVSHLHSNTTPTTTMLSKVLRPHRSPLETYLLVCPMAMDRTLARHQQDIIIVATGLESRCPVEISLQPPFERAIACFGRKDVSWLHVDTHGNAHSIMLGPSRDCGKMGQATDLPPDIPVPLVILVGCDLTYGATSIGSTVLERGATSVWGPCVTFASLALAGSDTAQTFWYEKFFQSLLDGRDVGESLLTARQTIQDASILKFAWLLLGSSLLSFRRQQNGA